jgi:glutamine amidotransferase-like uncharacterized protein
VSKPVALINVEVPPDVLGLTRFIFHTAQIPLVHLAATRLREPGALAEFGAVLFPGGGAELYERDLGPAGVAQLRDYVTAGGGLIGICAGCIFLHQVGLLTGQLFTMAGIGIYNMNNKRVEHPVWAGCAEVSRILRVNGPFIEVAAPTVSLADYEPTGRYACIVARTLGRGRIVGFSAHPEGGLAWGGGKYNPHFYYDGTVNGTDRLLKNALAWVTEPSGAAQA